MIAINLREDDGRPATSWSAPGWSSAEDDLLLVSRKGQSVRFTATDEALRPMGRATSGVTGMKFRDGDDLLAMDVVAPTARTRTCSWSSRTAWPSGRRLAQYRLAGPRRPRHQGGQDLRARAATWSAR